MTMNQHENESTEMSQKLRPQGQTSDVREKQYSGMMSKNIFSTKKKCEQITNQLTAKVKVAEYMKKN